MIRCAIIDDEPLAIKLLETYLSKLDHLDLAYSYSNPLEAITALQKDPVDLVFLDIQMPELTGVQLARVIPSHTKIIFTTAYPDYAVEGFELKALDYLVKPISLHRFIDAVGRMENHNTKGKTTQDAVKFIFVKTEYRKQKIDLKDIYYLKGMGDYCQIVLENEKIMTLEKMRDFETRLPPNAFKRVHKSYIIALDKIEFIEKNRIKIKEERIPIGPSYEKEIKELLK